MSPTRRDVLKLGAVTGAALVLEVLPGGRIVKALAATSPASGAGPWAPNPWLAIGEDGRVTVTVARGEMGQGVRTSLPMIVAEELDCEWQDVTVVNAEPGPRYPQMRTSGSWSVGGGWEPLRFAGAAARDMLVRGAAQRWSVPVAECTTERGAVVHAASKRRLTYGALVTAARALDPPEKPALKSASSFRVVGTRVARIDGSSIVTGAASYGIDVRVPNMLFASIERGPHLGATVAKLDDQAARKTPGVRQVVRLTNGVAVVASDTWSAQRGRELLNVEWTPGPRATFDSRAFRRGLLESSQQPGFEARAEGDVESALTGAAKRLDAVYEYEFQVHAPLEPMNAIARVSNGVCDLWMGTQAANQVQEAVAKQLAIDPSAVRIHTQLMGGGFGRRLGVDFALEAVEVAKAVQAPVQVLWTRADDMRHGFYQPASAHRMAGGLDAQGKVVAWKHTMAGVPHSALRPTPKPSVELAQNLMWGGFDNPYRVPNLRVAHVTLDPPVPTGPWRAVHYPPGVLARECFLDELAKLAGRDPLALRLELLSGPPDTNRTRLVRVMQTAAKQAGWNTPRPAGRACGLAANIYDGETVLAQVAEVSVAGDEVKVHRMVCAVDCGRVVNPLGLEAQIESAIVWGLGAALRSRITFANGIAEQSSFADYPVLAMADMPAIDVYIVPSDLPPLGIGEQGVSPVAAALNNAIFAATGKPQHRSPVLNLDNGTDG
jgi:isoquinoline 1-oxidoreductase beta subunit